MDKVIWKDKQMFTLDEIKDMETLVEEHVRRTVQGLIYQKSQLVKIFGAGKVLNTPVPGDSVIVPECLAVHEGRLLHLFETTINVAGTPASEIVLIPAGAAGTPPPSGFRTDTIVVRFATLDSDPKNVWYIDPLQIPPKRFSVYENSRTRDAYEFGILRGLDNSGTPRPFTEGDWVEVCKVDVRAGMTPSIQEADIVTKVPITQFDILFDPVTGHKHLGVSPGDAPKLDHDLSIDQSTVKPDQHHSKLHNINDPAHHTGSLAAGQHGAILTGGPYHDMTGIQGVIIPAQHGVQPALVGGLPAHGPVTLSSDGYMTAADKAKIDAMSLPLSFVGRSFTGGGGVIAPPKAGRRGFMVFWDVWAACAPIDDGVRYGYLPFRLDAVDLSSSGSPQERWHILAFCLQYQGLQLGISHTFILTSNWPSGFDPELGHTFDFGVEWTPSGSVNFPTANRYMTVMEF